MSIRIDAWTPDECLVRNEVRGALRVGSDAEVVGKAKNLGDDDFLVDCQPRTIRGDPKCNR